MTGLQNAVYEWSKSIEGEDTYKLFEKDIEKLNNLEEVYNYYTYTRDWYYNRDLMETLTWLLVDLARNGF